MDNIGYYLFMLAVIVVGFIVVRKVASCMIKSVVLLVAIAALAAIYYLYIRQ
ncbi:MAG: hypothetical protein IJP74_12395 [Prevotella sp.]|nr:hypothetical protein [Prevotella sp.]